MATLMLVMMVKILPVIAGVYYFGHLGKSFRLTLYLTAIAFVCEIYGLYIGRYLHRHNSWLFNIYMMLEVWLAGAAAIYLMDLKKKWPFWGILVLDTIFWIINLAMGSIFIFANVAMVAGLIVLTMMYLVLLFNNCVFKDRDLLRQPVFWLSLSTIIYCACDIPYFGMHNYFIGHAPALAAKMIRINSILDIIRYPLVAISFILVGQQKQVILNAA